MTQREALEEMMLRYPGCSVSVGTEMWSHRTEGGSRIDTEEFTVYAGTRVHAHAMGSGGSWEEALKDCKEAPL